MNAIVTLAFKDLRLLSRDWFGLFWIFAFPLMFGLFFGAIFSGMGSEGANALDVAIVDEDQSAGSKSLIERLNKSPALALQELDKDAARNKVLAGKLVAYILLKKGFGDAPVFGGGPDKFVEVGIDPSRKAEREMVRGVLLEASFAGMQDMFDKPDVAAAQMTKMRDQIVQAKELPPNQKKTILKFYDGLEDFFRDMKFVAKDTKDAQALKGFQGLQMDIVEVTADQRGPRSAFEITFPSSILWGIMGCVTTFAISLVIERMQGTLQRLRIAPLTRRQILAGKGLACFLACNGVCLALLGVGWLLLGVRLPDPLQLAMAIGATSLCFVGIMMLVSTLGKTEAAVAGAGWGILMPLAMIGGAMVPLFIMPDWMQAAASISPIKWGILALEGAIWRGYSMADMLMPCGILAAVGIVCYSLGVANLARQEA